MEIKSGDVQLRKGLLKKTSKKWLVIISKTQDGPAQLEAYENKEQYEKHHQEPSGKPEKHKHKVYSMESLNEDDIDKVAKKSSKEFFVDINLKKEKITLILDSSDEVEEWYNAIISALSAEVGQDGIKENLLYQSQDSSAPTFSVTVQETDASSRMSLHGKYNLIVTPSSLMLEDKRTREYKCTWAFEFIRRYGLDKKSGIFTIEAGRRCSTGEGIFELIVGKEDQFALPNAIDGQVKKKTGQGNLTTKLGVERKSQGDSNVITHSENRRSAPVATNNDSTNNSVKSDRDSRVSLRSHHHPSHVSEEFAHKLEEQIAHPPPSPDKDSKDHKEKSKSKGFNFFKKDKNKSSDRKSDKEKKSNKKANSVKKGERVYDEASVTSVSSDLDSQEPLYDEADVQRVKQAPTPQGVMYDDAETLRQKAWQNYGQSGEVHEEDYDKIKKAAKENEGKNFDDFNRDGYDEEDDTYDRVELQDAHKKASKKSDDDSKNIYGFSSGKAITDIPDEEDYDTADFQAGDRQGYEDDDEDPYDDTGLVSPQPDDEQDDDQYADAASVSKNKSKPPVAKRNLPKRKPVLYEEVQ